MSNDTRCKDFNWSVRTKERARADDGATFDGAQLAVLMDIRDELRALNAVLGCINFRRVPRYLRDIRRNTTKKRK